MSNEDYSQLLQEGAELLPEKFHDYWMKYCNRDVGRCESTIALLPPASDGTKVL